jgi:formate dehydrogenase subunit gamma
MSTERDAMKQQVIEAITAARADGDRGPLLPALHAVQATFGHIPDEAIGVLAEEFNLSRADVYGVVTFYRDFRREPAGRTRVRICAAEACQSVGARALAAAVSERLGVPVGSTDVAGTVTLEEVFCLGNCALGPSASVDGRVIGRASVERIAEAVAPGVANHEVLGLRDAR